MKSTPPTSLPALPDDPAALKALIARMQTRMDELQVRSLRLEMELLKYKKWMYGPRADRLTTVGQVHQMLLGFGEDLDARPAPTGAEAAELAAQDQNATAGTTPSRRVRRGRGGRGGRRNLGADAFAQLPVTRCEHDLPEADKPCPCCRAMRVKIGEESTWQIEYIPGPFASSEHRSTAQRVKATLSSVWSGTLLGALDTKCLVSWVSTFLAMIRRCAHVGYPTFFPPRRRWNGASLASHTTGPPESSLTRKAVQDWDVNAGERRVRLPAALALCISPGSTFTLGNVRGWPVWLWDACSLSITGGALAQPGRCSGTSPT